jgi:hypothetical protein
LRVPQLPIDRKRCRVCADGLDGPARTSKSESAKTIRGDPDRCHPPSPGAPHQDGSATNPANCEHSCLHDY